MLSAIASALGGQIIDSLLGKITGVFEAYFNKQISIEELRAKMVLALYETFAEVEKAHADSLTKTYESFQVTMRQSPMIQTMWGWVVGTQLAVLLWHQVGIPAFVKITGSSYPSSGSTVEWSYALIGFMFGAGALLLRSGPGAPASMIDKLKSVVGK
jgi:hypothetical protein